MHFSIYMSVCLIFLFFFLHGIFNQIDFFLSSQDADTQTESTHSLLLICSPAVMRTRRAANGCSTWISAVFGLSEPLKETEMWAVITTHPQRFGGRENVGFSWRC